MKKKSYTRQLQETSMKRVLSIQPTRISSSSLGSGLPMVPEPSLSFSVPIKSGTVTVIHHRSSSKFYIVHRNEKWRSGFWQLDWQQIASEL